MLWKNKATAYIDKSPFGMVKACDPIALIGLSESSLVKIEQNQIRVAKTLATTITIFLHVLFTVFFSLLLGKKSDEYCTLYTSLGLDGCVTATLFIAWLKKNKGLFIVIMHLATKLVSTHFTQK